MTVGIAFRDRLLFAMREAGGTPSPFRSKMQFFRLLYGAFTGVRRVNCLWAPSD